MTGAGPSRPRDPLISAKSEVSSRYQSVGEAAFMRIGPSSALFLDLGRDHLSQSPQDARFGLVDLIDAHLEFLGDLADRPSGDRVLLERREVADAEFRFDRDHR